jgi:DNA-binding winged helix-turn-helix (wHTH) protein/tetratricopeptide (TPR) repeat protein
LDAIAAAPPIAIDLASERPFRVGRASIDPISREAAFDGQSERLQPQNLKVLVALTRDRGKVVTRDQLVDLCWDGRFVGEDVINRAISNLRQFAERAGGFSIETVPRSGYRLVETSPSRRWRRWATAAVIVVIMLLAGFAFIQLRPRNAARPMPTIAVLPFTTASADPFERKLASDARDALAHTLSQTEFRVRLANSESERAASATDFIVSGNVSSRPQTIVATVHVEDTVHDVIVYSQVFEADRASAANLPDQIGAQIAGSLGWTASLLMLERRYPSDPAIIAELFGNGENYQRARQIAAKAPNSVLAQLSLAYGAAGALVVLPRDQRPETAAVARRAMERVHVLAPGFGGADIVWCFLHSRVRMIECEDHLRTAMRIDPDSAWADNILANRLKDVGRMNEALELAQNSLARDPFAQEKIEVTVRLLGAVGQRAEAENLYRDSLRWWPDDAVIVSGVVYGTMDRGDFEALVPFIKAMKKDYLVNSYGPGLPVLAAIHARDAGWARKLCPLDQDPSFKLDLCMLALARLGDNDDAFAIAARIYPNRIGRTPAEEDALWLDDPLWGESDILTGASAAPLRRDPRYFELARRIGLLEYWRSGRVPDFCQPPNPEPICSQLRRR